MGKRECVRLSTHRSCPGDKHIRRCVIKMIWEQPLKRVAFFLDGQHGIQFFSRSGTREIGAQDDNYHMWCLDSMQVQDMCSSGYTKITPRWGKGPLECKRHSLESVFVFAAGSGQRARKGIRISHNDGARPLNEKTWLPRSLVAGLGFEPRTSGL